MIPHAGAFCKSFAERTDLEKTEFESLSHDYFTIYQCCDFMTNTVYLILV